MLNRHFKALAQIVSRLSLYGDNWAITGTTGLALNGLPIVPSDIDIISDVAGVYSIQELMIDFVQARVKYSVADRIRSHYGRLLIDGVSIDIMGGVENQFIGEHTWQKRKDWQREIHDIRKERLVLPVLNLSYEKRICRKLGWQNKVDLIESFLTKKSSSKIKCLTIRTS